MKNLNFSDGLEEYSLNDRVTVRFNPTDLALRSEVQNAVQGELTAREKRIAKYTGKYSSSQAPSPSLP